MGRQMKSPNNNDNPAPKPMPLTLPAQRPALSTSDLIVYLDAEGTRFIKSSAVPEMSDGALRAAHQDVQELLCQLKARRDALNKRARRKELADPRHLQKAKRWIAKAGTLNVLIEHEIHQRKAAAAVALAEAFVQEARRLLRPEQFDQVLTAAIHQATR